MTSVDTLMQSPCAALACDAQGKVVGWNMAAERILGYRPEEVLGRDCSQVLCGRDIYGNRFCTSDCSLREMLNINRPINDFIVHVQTASGRFLKVELSVLYVYLRDPDRDLLVHIIKSAEDLEDLPGGFVPTR